jgi:hypothetical protein
MSKPTLVRPKPKVEEPLLVVDIGLAMRIAWRDMEAKAAAEAKLESRSGLQIVPAKEPKKKRAKPRKD